MSSSLFTIMATMAPCFSPLFYLYRLHNDNNSRTESAHSSTNVRWNWCVKTALFVCALILLTNPPGCQSVCTNAGFSGTLLSEDCLEMPYKIMADANTSLANVTNSTSDGTVLILDKTGNNMTGDPSNNRRVTTRRPPSPTKPDIVDPYDDEGKAKRDMLVAILVPIGLALIIVFCAIFLVKCCCKEKSEDSRCIQFWSSYGYHLPNPNPNQPPEIPVGFI